MTDYTPGPWSYRSRPNGSELAPAVYGIDNRFVADCWHYAAEPVEMVANARLIAAAPEMYELLDAIVYDLHGKTGTATVGWMTVESIQRLLSKIGGAA